MKRLKEDNQSSSQKKIKHNSTNKDADQSTQQQPNPNRVTPSPDDELKAMDISTTNSTVPSIEPKLGQKKGRCFDLRALVAALESNDPVNERYPQAAVIEPEPQVGLQLEDYKKDDSSRFNFSL